ncbi:MAG TPA: nuclear transport factor 2 family protein [Pyrinomonadaceae bacterium]|nr:nuclear transport factor 2 family protein [Pyrinomonadaceae bacterium]
MRESDIEAVERYLDALRSKDLNRAPLAADIVFADPLVGELTCEEAWREFIRPMLPAFKDVRVKQHLADGDYVATLGEADTVWGIIPIFELFRVEDGRIKEARAFFDPRPINA